MNLYFDNASSVLYSKELLTDIIADTNKYSNPHSFNNESQNSANKIEEIRNKVLSYIGASQDEYECVFTSGATDSLKRVGEYFNWNNNTNFIYTIDNHTSVVGIREYALQKGANVTVVDFDDNNDIIEMNTWFRPENKCMQQQQQPEENKNVNLFAMPYESNFSGKKYQIDNINKVKSRYGENTVFLLDTAKYIASNPINLSLSNNIVDIAVISFYKMFGFPTGLGALIIKKSIIKHLKRKHYFGGGTVAVSSSEKEYVISRNQIYEWLEDGSPHYLGIIALDKSLEKVINYDMISRITYDFYIKIRDMKYSTRQKVFELYDTLNSNADSTTDSNVEYDEFKEKHGSIITFNLLNADGSYIGYKDFEKVCALNGIAIRTGCLCNVGACSKNLNISFTELQTNFEMGHSCGDDMDIIDGKPTGAIRVSFGSFNKLEEVDIFIEFIKTNFMDYYSKVGDTPTTPIGISHTTPIGISHTTPIGISHTTPIEIWDASIRLSHTTMSGLFPTIENIIIYPIKSGGMFEVKSWSIGSSGFLYDREWSLINSENKVLQQKRYRQMAQLKCSIDLSTNILRVSYGTKSLDIDIYYTPEESVTQKQCVHTTEGYVYSDEINAWFSDCLGITCKLVRTAHSRQIESTENKLSFSNEGQFLVVNNKSIEDINNKGNFNYNYTRYRPNIVITTTNAYDEDNWNSIENSTTKLKVFKKCPRCAMVNISQQEKDLEDIRNQDKFEPLKTLSKYRREKGTINFGILLYTEYGSTITVGDVFDINYKN